MAKEPVTAFDFMSAFKALDELDYPTPTKATRRNLKESVRVGCLRTDCLFEDFYDVNSGADLEAAAEERAADLEGKLDTIARIVADDGAPLTPSAYVGKKVVQCPRCMTLFYKAAEDITKDENSEDTVNVGEVCQHCGNDSGYTLIGKVEAVEPEATEEVPAEETVDTAETEADTTEPAADTTEGDEAPQAGEEDADEGEETGDDEMPAVEETQEEEAPVEESFMTRGGYTLTEDVTLVQDENAEQQKAAAPTAGEEVKQGAQELASVAANYDEFVQKLQSDPKAAAFIDYIKNISAKGERTNSGVATSFGSIDIVKGAKENDSIAAGGLLPTQNVIFMGKSFGANWGEKWGPLSVGEGGKSCLEAFCFKSPSVGNDGMPVIIYNDGTHNYLIDGHHRWSKVVAVNPTGTMKALVFGPVPGFTWTDCLEAVQMAIEAAGGYKKNESLTEATLTEAVADENANLIELKKTGGAITDAILSEKSKWLTDVKNTRFLIQKWDKADELKIPDNATEVPAEVRKACAQQIEANIAAGIGNPPGTAPGRKYMPQVDGAASPSQAIAQLKKGVIDITPQTNESLHEDAMLDQSPEAVVSRLTAFADSIDEDLTEDLTDDELVDAAAGVQDNVLTEAGSDDEEFRNMITGPIFRAFKQGLRLPKNMRSLAESLAALEEASIEEEQEILLEDLPSGAIVQDFVDRLQNAGAEYEQQENARQQASNPEEVVDSLEEIDEVSVEECMNKALTEVYENVKNVKLTGCTMNENLCIEAVINFKSGKAKETKFSFTEAVVAPDNKRLVLRGGNSALTEGKKAFTLACNIVNKKLVAEGLKYSYSIGKDLVEGYAKASKK